MPRPQQYESNAAKQAAYRQRHSQKQPPRQALLASLVRTLHSTIEEAAAGGDSLATEVLGERSDQTLLKLIAHFNGQGAKK